MTLFKIRWSGLHDNDTDWTVWMYRLTCFFDEPIYMKQNRASQDKKNVIHTDSQESRDSQLVELVWVYNVCTFRVEFKLVMKVQTLFYSKSK